MIISREKIPCIYNFMTLITFKQSNCHIIAFRELSHLEFFILFLNGITETRGKKDSF